ncbi:MAG: S41 family peptidase [Thermoanaerobaculia bacterium]|nr:S41 family peptidase [Thermoanaerobaculia bacterium]
MLSRGRLAFIFVSFLAVLLVVAGTISARSNAEQEDGTDSPFKYLSVFMDVFSLVSKAYVDEPEGERLMAGAFEGTIDALDPFSLYIPEEYVETYRASREIGSRRSGLVLLKERGVAYVVAVEEGSPAASAGLEMGDILSEINGLRTRSTPLFSLIDLLAGEPGTRIEVERLRQGQKKQLGFELADYDPPSVVLEARRGVPVLAIPAFFEGTVASVEQSLSTVARGAQGLPGLQDTGKLVIDLRGVAGGDAASAYRIAGLFVSGELGALLQRGKALESFVGAAPKWSGEVALLTDRGTQGAAEVFASILHQATEAKLVGSRTFGHSGRHVLVELSDGARLQLTDAFYTGPDRSPINKSLEPDVRVRQWLVEAETEGTDAETSDPVLEAGLDALLEPAAEEEREAAA